MITNQLLYQLSYTGFSPVTCNRRKRKYYKISALSASGRLILIGVLNMKIYVDDCLIKRLR
jgi:hypothetical protein